RARQMRDQVGVGRPQHQECLAGGELDARAFLDAEQIVGAQLAADEQLLARPQHLQVAAPLAIDKNYGVVFFEVRVQGDSTLARIARAGNTPRPGVTPAPTVKAALRCRARPLNTGQPCQRPGFALSEGLRAASGY